MASESDGTYDQGSWLPAKTKLTIYMVKHGDKYFRRAAGWQSSWVTDPQKASVWTTYQGPAAAIAEHQKGERIDLEVELP